MKKEKVSVKDFMENDNNPILKRLTDKLMNDPEFIKILKDGGYKSDK